MMRHRFSKLEEFEDRHPGLCRQVEALLKARIPVRKIAAVLQAQYGERISPLPLRSYRMECWDIWRNRNRKASGDRPRSESGRRATQEPGEPANRGAGQLKARSAAAGSVAWQ